MAASGLRFRRALWMLAACTLLLPRVAAAVEPTVAADLDGDGRRDRVVLDSRQPSGFSVWLSATGATEVIRTRKPLLRLIAADLDGDHRPELVALDGELRMHVWTRRGNQFRSLHRKPKIPGTLKRPQSRTVNNPDDDDGDVITDAPFAPFALVLCASPRAPALEQSGQCSPEVVVTDRSHSIDPFAPRPPPISTPL